MNVSLDEQIECAERELRRRRKFFPAMVEAEKIDPDHARAEIARMDAIRQTLAQLRGLVLGGKVGGGETLRPGSSK